MPSRFMRKMSADPSRMKSAGNRALVQRRLQMLHIHVFLVAPLSACHVAEPCADQRQGGVTIPPYGSCGGSHCSVIDYFVGIGVCKLCLLLSIFLFEQPILHYLFQNDFKQGNRIMPGITIRKISRAANHYSADSLFYSSATPFSTSSQTILTTKLASCLHLEMIYSFVLSVIPFIL